MRTAVLLLFLSVQSWAATCTASTFAQFQTCVTNAAAGDTVQVSSSFTWTASVTATVGITIQGTNQTMTTGGFSLNLDPTVITTTLMRVTGLIFSITGATAIQVDGLYAIDPGGWNLLRIDNNTFTQGDNLSHSIIFGFNTWRNFSPCPNIYGLVDHNTFNNTNSGANNSTIMLIQSCNENWNSDPNLGTSSALYIEQNTFNCNQNWNPENDIMDADYGARYVIRNNTSHECSVLGHDVGSQAESSGQRAWEFYNNTFTAAGTQLVNSWGSLRGGTGFWHHNNVQISLGAAGANLLNDTEIQRLLCLGSVPFGTDSCGASGVGCTQTSRRICSTLRSYCASGANARKTCDSTNNGDAFCGGGAGSCAATCTADTQCPVGSVCLSNGSGGGLDGPASGAASGYFCRNQTGASKTVLSPNTNQTSDPVYLWHNCNTIDVNTAPCSSGSPVTGMKEVFQNTGIAGFINPDRDYFGWNTLPGASQTSGTSEGLLSARPNCGLVGVGYWATDTNTLYTCTVTGTPGTWITKYQPFTFPHPLQAGVGGGGGSGSANFECYIISGASTNATLCSHDPATRIRGISLYNTTTTVGYLRLYNLNSVPNCASATGFIKSIPVPPAAVAGSAGATVVLPPQPTVYSSGMGFCITGGSSSTDNTNSVVGIFGTILFSPR